MATKDGCQFGLSIYPTSKTPEYSNINLNKNSSKCYLPSSTYEGKISTFDNSRRKSPLKGLSNKFDQCLNFNEFMGATPKPAFNYRQNRDRGQQKPYKNDRSSNSTLSIHICAYDSLMKDTKSDKNARSQNSKFEKDSVLKKLTSTSIKHAFEFPRQMRKDDEDKSPPEIYQFKASQKLCSINSPPSTPPQLSSELWQRCIRISAMSHQMAPPRRLEFIELPVEPNAPSLEQSELEEPEYMWPNYSNIQRVYWDDAIDDQDLEKILENAKNAGFISTTPFDKDILFDPFPPSPPYFSGTLMNPRYWAQQTTSQKNDPPTSPSASAPQNEKISNATSASAATGCLIKPQLQASIGPTSTEPTSNRPQPSTTSLKTMASQIPVPDPGRGDRRITMMPAQLFKTPLQTTTLSSTRPLQNPIMMQPASLSTPFAAHAPSSLQQVNPRARTILSLSIRPPAPSHRMKRSSSSNPATATATPFSINALHLPPPRPFLPTSGATTDARRLLLSFFPTRPVPPPSDSTPAKAATPPATPAPTKSSVDKDPTKPSVDKDVIVISSDEEEPPKKRPKI